MIREHGLFKIRHNSAFILAPWLPIHPPNEQQA